jgi:hypothetical protein
MASVRNLLHVAITATIISVGSAQAVVNQTAAVLTMMPWEFSIERALVIAVEPLRAAPSPPRAYSGLPAFTWVGGGAVKGLIVALQFSDRHGIPRYMCDVCVLPALSELVNLVLMTHVHCLCSPVGAYSELFFLPGLYMPPCGSGAHGPYLSVQRIWVDSMTSRRAGRSIWGVPKEMASFKWHTSDNTNTPRWTSVAITGSSREIIFAANISDLAIASPDLRLASWLLPEHARTVLQWSLPEEEEANQTEKPHRPTSALLTQLSFSVVGATVGRVVSMRASVAQFVGDTDTRALTALPIAARFGPGGSRAFLSAPVPLPAGSNC